MGAKQSKSGEVKQNGADKSGEEGQDSLDTFDKTSTLPVTFRSKDDETEKSGTLPREGVAAFDRNTSFSKRFRKSVSKLVGHKAKQEGCTDSIITEDSDKKKEINGDFNKNKDEKESTVKSPIDHKLAQKIARAKFFQELYSTPTNVPKPPRSRNGFSLNESGVSEDGIDSKANNTTPVVKLIEKHQEAIEKHQEEIRNSMGSPDILKGRMDSFRKSKLVENSDGLLHEKKSTTVAEQESATETNYTKVEEINFETRSQLVSDENFSVSEISSSQITPEVLEVSESDSVIIKEESATFISKLEEFHTVREEVALNSENLTQESVSLTDFVFEEKREENTESIKVKEEISSVKQTSQLDGEVQSEVHVETNASSEISHTYENQQIEASEATFNEESEQTNQCEENNIINDESMDSDSAVELDVIEKDE